MKVFKIIITVIFAAIISACAKTTVISDQAISSVEVLYTQPTDRSYKELGLVSTQTGQTIFHDKSNEGMILKLQEKAHELGADAIIVSSLDESTWGFKGDNSTGFDKGKAVAVAIQYND
jgi:hypothetical protein